MARAGPARVQREAHSTWKRQRQTGVHANRDELLLRAVKRLATCAQRDECHPPRKTRQTIPQRVPALRFRSGIGAPAGRGWLRAPRASQVHALAKRHERATSWRHLRTRPTARGLPLLAEAKASIQHFRHSDAVTALEKCGRNLCPGIVPPNNDRAPPTRFGLAKASCLAGAGPRHASDVLLDSADIGPYLALPACIYPPRRRTTCALPE